MVDAETASSQAVITNMAVKDILKFKTAFLRRLRTDANGSRLDWERFVVIRADARDGMSMYPRFLPGATLLLDRHYNSLKPYRRNEPNMYAVHKSDECIIRYVQVEGENLILRPHNRGYPVEIMSMEAGASHTEYIVGRVCYVGVEI